MDILSKAIQIFKSRFPETRVGSVALDKYIERIKKVRDILARGEDLYNTDFTEMKSAFVSVMERLVDVTAYSDAHRAAGLIDANDYPGSWWPLGSAKKIKTFWDKHPDFPKDQELANLFFEFKQFIDTIKKIVVKGRKPKPVDPNASPAYRKKAVSYAVTKDTWKFLNDFLAGVRSEYMSQVYKQMDDKIAKINKEMVGAKSWWEVSKKIRDQDLYMSAQSLLDLNSRPLVLRKDWQEKATKMVANRVDDMISHILQRGTEKISRIIEKKGKPQAAKVIRHSFRGIALEIQMLFQFEDGSSFETKITVEFALSNRGKAFYRFPTRFTNVKMADGSKMSAPNERKMIEVF